MILRDLGSARHGISPPRPTEIDRFDYIVVGGGSTGCVVASRLSEDPAVRVLLIEEGPRDLSP